jgi:hypothetical protein
MQTIGATLLGIKRCNLGRVWLAAHDGPSVHGLLYLAAVQLRTCQRCVPQRGQAQSGRLADASSASGDQHCPAGHRPAVDLCFMLVWFGACRTKVALFEMSGRPALARMSRAVLAVWRLR